MSQPTLEDLLFACLEAPDSDRERRLDSLCAAYPDRADSLRRMYARMTQLGFVQRERAEWHPPSQLGPYRLEFPIGRGGMGLVYRARQTSAGDRIVAVKLLRPELVADPRARARFLREATLASRLDHPNLCGVLDAGEDGAITWIAMRYIEGTSLAESIADARAQGTHSPRALPVLTPGADPSVDGLLRTFVELANGLAHAHDRGMLHRDVKPGNILVQPDGTPVLLDFGLARDLEQTEGLTLSSDLLGTPAYMAPEQLDRTAVLDGRTDVYALGATLYECLSLELPHPGATRDEMLRRIRRDPAPDPRRIRAWLPASVAAIVEGALQPDRSHRYESARAFAEDLQRALGRQPVAIRRRTTTQRVRAWVRLNPWPTAAGGILALGLAMTSVFASIATWHARVARAGDLVGRSLAAQGFDPVAALDYAISAFDLDNTPLTRDRLHHAMRAARVVARVPIDEIATIDLAFSRDGQRLAVVGRGTVAILDRAGRTVQRCVTPETDRAVIATTGGRFVVLLGGIDGAIRRWTEDAPGEAIELPGPRATPRAGKPTFKDATLAPGHDRAVFAAADGCVYEIAPLAGSITQWRLAADADSVSRCCFLADGSVVAALQRQHSDDDPTLDTDLYRRRGDRIDGPIAVRGPAGSRLGARFMEAGPADGQVWLGVPFGLVLFDLDASRPIKRFTTLYDVHSIAVAGPHVFAGHSNGVVQRWEQNGADKPYPIPWHSSYVDRLLAAKEPFAGLDDDTTLVAACTNSGRIQIGRGTGWRMGEPLCGTTAAVIAMALDPKQELIASATADGFVQLWRQRDPTPNLLHPTGPFFGHFVQSGEDELFLAQHLVVAWRGTPGNQAMEMLGEFDSGYGWTQLDVLGDRLARVDDLWLSLHDSHTGALLAPRVRIAQASCGVAMLGPDRIWVAINGGARARPRLQTWQFVDSELRLGADIEVADCWDRNLTFWHHARTTPDGELIAVACRDGTARVYRRDGRAVGPPLWHQRGPARIEVLRVAIAPDQRRVATAGQDGRVNIWIRTGAASFVEEGIAAAFSSKASSVEFDASGSRIACCSDDGTLRVLTADGRELLEDFRVGAGLRCCRFSPDGRYVRVTTNDGRLLTWFLDSRQLRERAAALLPTAALDQSIHRAVQRR